MAPPVPAPPHHPPHFFVDDAWHLVTSATYGRLNLFQSTEAKRLLRDRLRELAGKFDLRLAAWVILDNHYHIMIRSQSGAALPTFFQRLHGRTSFELNGLQGARGRQVWHNYWDTCIRTEADYWVRFNYIHHNPVKHNYVASMEQWPFSSYGYYLKHRGAEWLADAFRKYPVIDFTDANDSF